MFEAVKLGIGVYRPLVDGSRCDLILELGSELVRVQCKWARRHGGVLAIRCYSSRRSRAGFVRRLYASDEIDGFAAFCPELARCYFIPIAAFPGQREVRLRLAPSGSTGLRSTSSRLHWELAGP